MHSAFDPKPGSPAHQERYPRFYTRANRFRRWVVGLDRGLVGLIVGLGLALLAFLTISFPWWWAKLQFWRLALAAAQ